MNNTLTVCVCVFSLQDGQSKASELPLKVKMAWTSEDSTTSGKKQSPPLVSELLFIQRTVEVFNVLWFSDDTGSTEKKQKTKRKKKNCFRRFFSWMKKNLCSCWTCAEEDEQGERWRSVKGFVAWFSTKSFIDLQGQHGGSVAGTVASQQKVLALNLGPLPVCVEFACSPRVFAWVSTGFSGFLPHSKDMQLRWTGHCKCKCKISNLIKKIFKQIN